MNVDKINDLSSPRSCKVDEVGVEGVCYNRVRG